LFCNNITFIYENITHIWVIWRLVFLSLLTLLAIYLTTFSSDLLLLIGSYSKTSLCSWPEGYRALTHRDLQCTQFCNYCCSDPSSSSGFPGSFTLCCPSALLSNNCFSYLKPVFTYMCQIQTWGTSLPVCPTLTWNCPLSVWIYGLLFIGL
jgi:hypothetical protein